MKLLFVLENYVPHIGGVEIVFQNLCEGLAKKHDITVITHRLKGTKKREMRNGVRILRVNSLQSRYAFTFAAIPTAVKHAGNSDIIHTTTYNGAFPAWIASVLRRKPAIITVHETWLGKWKKFSNFSLPIAMLHETLEWLLYRLTSFDSYVCVSNSTKNMLAVKKRKVTIHNGFDPTPWKQKKDTTMLRKRLGLKGNFVIFAAGRPGTTKGFEYLVRAFPKIKQQIPNAVLLLMLSTDKQYRHKIAEMRRSAISGVQFLTPKPFKELPAYRQMADCNVVPSTSEGFGYAVLESVSSGTPTVATNTTSIPEVIFGKHVLVKPKNSSAIANGVIQVYKKQYNTTPEKKFPWSSTIAAYEREYKRYVA